MAKKTEQTKETVEKKQVFLESGITQQKKKDGGAPPMHLTAMFIVLALLAGAAITMTLMKPAEPVNGDVNGDVNGTINDSTYRIVPVTIVYSDECRSCRDTTTIEDLFKVRQVLYSVKKVEAKSEEGSRIIDRFAIGMLPAAVVDSDKLAFYPKTKADFDAEVSNGAITKIGSAYIVPEQNWNQNFYYPLYYVDRAPRFCDSDSGKPTIVQFDDYYNPDNTKGRAQFYSFLKDFNTLVDFKYSYLQTQYSQDDNSIFGNLLLSCAGNKGMYPALENSITGIYCNNPFAGDPTIVTDVEINGCWTISEHYGKPLSQIELDIAANRAGWDADSVKACYDGRYSAYNEAERAADSLHIERTGTFLIDCRETASLGHLRESFCALHPEIAACADSQ